MIGEHSTLEDVCFEVSAALESCGIECVLTGGSAAAGMDYISKFDEFLKRVEVFHI